MELERHFQAFWFVSGHRLSVVPPMLSYLWL
jgi:hypothetical protein